MLRRGGRLFVAILTGVMVSLTWAGAAHAQPRASSPAVLAAYTLASISRGEAWNCAFPSRSNQTRLPVAAWKQPAKPLSFTKYRCSPRASMQGT